MLIFLRWFRNLYDFFFRKEKIKSNRDYNWCGYIIKELKIMVDISKILKLLVINWYKLVD